MNIFKKTATPDEPNPRQSLTELLDENTAARTELSRILDRLFIDPGKAGDQS